VSLLVFPIKDLLLPFSQQLLPTLSTITVKRKALLCMADHRVLRRGGYKQMRFHSMDVYRIGGIDSSDARGLLQRRMSRREEIAQRRERI
jgi:hypothetical protein